VAVAALKPELPPYANLYLGGGKHLGAAVVGCSGTKTRLEYTAISDSVNTTKRIQENCAKNQILISREAYERVKDEIEAKPFLPLSVKGKTQPLDVYEVLGLKA
jgi:adenylate cyclase